MWSCVARRVTGRAPRARAYVRRPVRRLHTEAAGPQQAARPPPTRECLKLGLASAVPFVGFGFMDQIVMITVGDQLDYHLGARLGIHTLTAAALGQVVSDTSGVLFGQFIDKLAAAIGLPKANLRPHEMNHPKLGWFRTGGMAIGVACGCFLGMISLLVLDLDKRERAERVKEVEPLMRSIVDSCHELLRAEHCNLWLVDAENEEYIWSRALNTSPPATENLRDAFNHISKSPDGVTAHQLLTAVGSIGRETNVVKVEQELLRIEKALGMEGKQVQSDLNKDHAFPFEVFAEYMREEVSAGLEVRIKIRPGGFKHSAIEGKKTVLRDPVVHDPRFNKVHNLVTGIRTRSVMVSPIISPTSHKVIGLIEVANKTSGSFSEDDVRIVELMSQHAAIFLEK
eukprot:m.64091 g.64091  ORF g.64091 m.64091 type:complete len:398 (-) comp8200_c0_seq2:153-1346(-)